MGRDLGPAKPEDVGLSTEGLARIDAAIQGYIDSGGLAGAVTLVARRGKIVHTCAMEKRTWPVVSHRRRTPCFASSP